MTLPTLATVSDLGIRLGRDIDTSEAPQADALLRYASALIRSYCGQSWVDDDDQLLDLPAGVAEVCAEVVFRAVANPAGVTQDTVGPFTVSFGSEAAQRLFLNKGDREILNSTSNRIGVLSVTRGPIETSPTCLTAWDGLA